MPGFTDDPARLPDRPGAYLILLELTMPVALPPRLGERQLDPGLYVYAGSAKGPGGVRARAGRHLRGNGTRRWHIDWLTAATASRHAMPLWNMGECAAITALRRAGDFETFVSGFGSSDCRTCDAHLLQALGVSDPNGATTMIEHVLFGS